MDFEAIIKAYPSITTISAFYNSIKAVKDANPKP